MEVTLKLDWPDHEHFFYTVTITQDHYNDIEFKACRLCDEAASQSGISSNKHFEHPRGCKCYWCVYCQCPKLLEREVAVDQ